MEEPHVAALLEDAASAAAAGDWARAGRLAEAVLVLNPGDDRATALLRRAEGATEGPGERRRLTLMFCDVVGSTALSSQSDPEVVREVLRDYQLACGDVITAHGGYVAQYVGDGIISYFGYPVAHEDDARRAVGASLEVFDALAPVIEAARSRHGVDLAVRVAVHTGLVVRADMGGRQRRERDAVVGETPNVAARLQEHAPPGTVIISRSTYDLVRPWFDCQSMGELRLRGITRPVEAYWVRAGLSVKAARDATPFVGRTEELGRMRSLWDATRGGESVVLLVRGDPGIGKSRLLAEFLAGIEEPALTAQCSSFHQATQLYPVRQLIEVATGIRNDSAPADALAALREALDGIQCGDLLGQFAKLLGLRPGGWESPEVDGPQLREETLGALVKWVGTAASAGPLLLTIDDLQWADPSTIELIARVARRRVPRLMLVMAARPGFAPSWPRLEVIEVGPLAAADLGRMAESLVESRSVDQAELELLIDRSDGVPLYLEELVRAAHAGPVDPEGQPDAEEIPAVLAESLLARLSVSGVDLAIAQTMATIGQHTDPEVLAAVVGLPDVQLTRKIDALVDAGIIEPDGPLGYRFHHHLVRDLAYTTQLRGVRRRRHSAIADVMATIELHGIPADAGQIAHHLEHADRISEAVGAYLDLADAGVASGAIPEAEATLAHALTLLPRVRDEKRRLSLELAVRQALGMIAVSATGYTSVAAGEQFERCMAICELLGPVPEHLPSLTTLYFYCLVRGELERCERTLTVDRNRLGIGPADAIPIEAGMAGVRFFGGDFTGAIADMEWFLGSPYARALTGTPSDWPLPDDPLVNMQGLLGLARAVADRDDWSDSLDAGIERASCLVFPHGAFATGFCRMLRLVATGFRGDHDGVLALCDAVEEVGRRHGFSLFTVVAACHRQFHVALTTGDLDLLPGIAMLWNSIGMRCWEPWLYGGGAETRLAHGDLDGAVADLAAAGNSPAGYHYFDSPLARIRGEVRVARGDDGGFEDLRGAVTIGERQGAHLFARQAEEAIRRLSGAG